MSKKATSRSEGLAPKTSLRDALSSGRVLLMDGAMGTQLLSRHPLPESERLEWWNVTRPDVVLDVHRAYADAGAEVHLTNTFQIVTAAIWMSCAEKDKIAPWLPKVDGRWPLTALQWPATALARCAAGPRGYVLADIGSFYPETSNDEFADLTMLRSAAGTLGPVDGVLLETCSSPRVRQAVRVVHEKAPQLPILLSLTYRKTDTGEIETITGHTPEWFAERAKSWGVDALGVNCGREIGMSEVIDVVRRYRTATDLPLFARPNAGTPVQKRGRWVYTHTPEAMAARVEELLEVGACMVGGCCGTTPEHIAAFKAVVDAWNSSRD